MKKRCHKCQKMYDTEDFFCNNCGNILYDESEPDENEQDKASDDKNAPDTNIAGAADVSKSETQNSTMESEREKIERDNKCLMRHIDILCSYATGATFRACTFMIITAVVLSSIFEAIIQFGSITLQGQKLNVVGAANVAFIIALGAFYTLLPAITMYKISADADQRNMSSIPADGAFLYKSAKSLNYIFAYYISQTVLSGIIIGFMINAAIISFVSGEAAMATVLFISSLMLAAVTMPFFISAIVTFSSARTCCKNAIPFKIRGGKFFAVYSAVINILAAVIIVVTLIFVSVIKLSDINLTSNGYLLQTIKKMGGTYLIYMMISLVRFIANVVLSFGFIKFLNKIERVKQ